MPEFMYDGPKIETLAELYKLLLTTEATVFEIKRNIHAHYALRLKAKKDSTKKRITYAPSKNLLRPIQRRIKDFILERYPVRDYTFGLGGPLSSPAANAKLHAGAVMVINMDIHNFFPSIPASKVQALFTNQFNFPPECAAQLTALTTYLGRLQQGLPSSSRLAVILAETMMDEIAEFCHDNNLVFSLYIDDITISSLSPGVNAQSIIEKVVRIARRYSFTIKAQKTKVAARAATRLVTGGMLNKDNVRAQKKLRKRTALLIKKYDESVDVNEQEALLSKIYGFLSFIQQCNLTDAKKLKDKLRIAKVAKGQAH